jgi:hypothetical protein
MKRTGFKKLTYEEALAKKKEQNSKTKKKTKKPAKTPRVICWDAFSLFIRLKYADENGSVQCYTCISEGHWEGDGFQAGHLVPGRGNSVYVNEKVVRVQCGTCNMWNGGEQYKFGKRMESEIGVEKVAELMKLKGQQVQYGKKDWEEMTMLFLEEAYAYAEEKEQKLPAWARKLLIIN